MGESTFRQGRKAATALRASRRAELGATGAGTRQSDLIGLTEDRFEDVSDARRRLRALEALLYERGDGRASFLTVYARVTEAVEEGLGADDFDDPAWVGAYLVCFANYYRRAFAAYERGDVGAVPDAWQLAFEAALTPETLVIQDVLLGVNAHVNYDLALTLHDVGIEPDRRSKAADHGAINHVLRGLVDGQQEQLASKYAAGLVDVDDRFGRVDEAFSFFTLREGRRNAWFGAVALSATRRVSYQRAVRWLLNAGAMGAGYLILTPTVSPSVLAALKSVETGAVDVPPSVDSRRP